MNRYRVKDWSEFQHYKDRSPPWIRLHKKLLDNFRFHSLPDASRALAPMLWLLASENNDLNSGIIEGPDEEIAFRLRRTVEEFRKAINPLIEKGFIDEEHDACNLLADCKRLATPETETETETETDSIETEEEREVDYPAIDYQRMVEIWNSTAGQLCPKVGKILENRRRALRNRIKDSFNGSVTEWEKYCTLVKSSNFLTGKNDRGWKADFDWALKPQNIAKVMEGKYANNGKTTAKHGDFESQNYRVGTEGFIVA